MKIKVGLIVLSILALGSCLGLDYSMTLKVIDRGTQVLYPAWPVNLKCGFWQIEPNSVTKGGSNEFQVRDKLGTCGSHLQVFYNIHTGKQVLRFQAITGGLNEQNNFKYTILDDRFKIDYKMKCGDIEKENQIVKENHPCYIEVYVSYKQKQQEIKKNQEL